MIPELAAIPRELVVEQFVATPLTAATAALDHAAYVASPDVIRVHSDGRWPVAEFTLEDDAALVAQHQSDHEAGRAFTFVLLTPSRDEALGCLYLNPLHDVLRRGRAEAHVVDAFPAASAMVTSWIRQDRQDTGLAAVVAEAVDEWLRADWPLATYVFRVLPQERSSRKALDRLDLRRIDLPLPGESRPYLWYQPTPHVAAGQRARTHHTRS